MSIAMFSSPFRSPRPRVLLSHFQGSLRAAAAASPRGRAGIAAGAGPATAQEAADGSVLGMPWVPLNGGLGI